MTRLERIKEIKRCEKAIYDLGRSNSYRNTYAAIGMKAAARLLRCKRKRLERKLKK